ncbi:MAG: apolipoprotein N-acyltransferase, partial [Candidatus Latescibacterota bacterium]
MRRLPLSAVVLVSAVMLASSQAPLGIAPLAWIALVPFLIVLMRRDVRDRDAMRLGLLFGFLLHAATLHWFLLLDPTSEFARPWFLIPSYLALATWLALPWSLVAFLVVRSRERLGAAALFWLPALIPWTEWLQAQGPLAFPWVRLGATQVGLLPLAQLASVVGVLALSAWVALVNVQLALLCVAAQRSRALLLLALLAALALPGARRAQKLASAWDAAAVEGSALRVALVQPDVELTVKWTMRDYGLQLLEGLTHAAAPSRPDLVVWPETAVTCDILQTPEVFERLGSLSRVTPLLCGFPSARRDARYANSAALIRDGTLLGRYGKEKLLPLGERLPRVLMQPGRSGSNFVATAASRPLEMAPRTRLGVLVCWESAFSSLARERARQGADLLVNVVNDGWFGRAVALQLAAQARLRAVETGLPLLRCANNGFSFVCGPSAEVRGVAAFRSRGVVEATLPPSCATAYRRCGDAPLLAACALLLVALAVRTGSR